jgi:tetratricopeptide (TPR) repeat protein
MPRHRIIVTLLIIPLLLIANNIDEAIRLFNSFQFDRAEEIFKEVIKEKNNPRIAEAYYYMGRLSVSPDAALLYYNEVINNYPTSRYADISYLEIAKIDIAREKYKSAIAALKELLQKFPDTQVKDETLFWLGVAHISGGQKEAGLQFFEQLKTSFPRSIWSERAAQIIPQTTGATGNEYFTVQVGSYRDKSNAQTLYQELTKKGLNVKIVEAVVKGNTYFRVWVGQFETLEGAKAFSLVLDSLGIKGNVVKGY